MYAKSEEKAVTLVGILDHSIPISLSHFYLTLGFHSASTSQMKATSIHEALDSFPNLFTPVMPSLFLPLFEEWTGAVSRHLLFYMQSF